MQFFTKDARPVYLFYTMVQKSQSDQKLKSRGGGRRPVSYIADPAVDRQNQLPWQRWWGTGLVPTCVCGGMVANRFDLLVLCFSGGFFFSNEVSTKAF